MLNDDYTKYRSIYTINVFFLAQMQGEERKRNTKSNVEFCTFLGLESPLINNDKCDKGVLVQSILSTVGLLKLM